MIITTTPNIEGKQIKKYLGIVTGEAVVAQTYSDPGLICLACKHSTT